MACFSFTDSLTVARGYALTPNNYNLDGALPHFPRVIAAYLVIENPLIDQRDGDPYLDLSILLKVLGKKRTEIIAHRYAPWIENTANWTENYAPNYESVAHLLDRRPNELGELYFNAYVALDDREIVGWLCEAGIDGAIHGGNGIGMGTTEFKVFSANQASYEMMRVEENFEL